MSTQLIYTTSISIDSSFFCFLPCSGGCVHVVYVVVVVAVSSSGLRDVHIERRRSTTRIRREFKERESLERNRGRRCSHELAIKEAMIGLGETKEDEVETTAQKNKKTRTKMEI